MKCIFSIAPVGNLEKSRESPDALRGGTGRWPLASGVLSGVAKYIGRTGVSPVLKVRCAAPAEGLALDCQLARDPSSGCIATTRTSLLGSK